MAHTNQTPNYELSQFLGTDKPAWIVDYNGDMEKIDLGLKEAKDVADTAKDEADQGALDIAAVTLTANSADAKATEALSNFADVYDATATYNVGDLVLYEGILYRCTTLISVPEPFNGAHWTRQTIENIRDLLQTEINSKASAASLVPVTQTFQAATHDDLYGNARITKTGNVAQLEIHGFAALQGNYENTVLNAYEINEAFRPTESVTFTITAPDNVVYRITITPLGALTVYPYGSVAGQNNVIHFMSYIIN